MEYSTAEYPKISRNCSENFKAKDQQNYVSTAVIRKEGKHKAGFLFPKKQGMR